MYTGDATPGNVNTNELDLNNGGWILIAILVCIIVVMIIIMFVMRYKMQTKIFKQQEQFQKGINEEEANLLLKYRTLNDRDKTIIRDTLKTLEKNNNSQKE